MVLTGVSTEMNQHCLKATLITLFGTHRRESLRDSSHVFRRIPRRFSSLEVSDILMNPLRRDHDPIAILEWTEEERLTRLERRCCPCEKVPSPSRQLESLAKQFLVSPIDDLLRTSAE